MANRKKKGTTNEDTTVAPRCLKRARSAVNYNETSDDDKNIADAGKSDSDFDDFEEEKDIKKIKCKYKESSSSDDDILLKNIKNKRKGFSKSRTIKGGITDESHVALKTMKGKRKGFDNGSTKKEDTLDKCSKNNPINVGIIKPSSFANICRPNLSEGESSESSDDDISPLKFNNQKMEETSSLNQNIIVEKAHDFSEICVEENTEKNMFCSEKRKMLFSETGNEIPDKSIKLEDPVSLKSIKLEDTNVVETITDKIPLSAKMSKQKKTSTNVKVKNKKTPKEVETVILSSEGSGSDDNWEDVDEKKVKTKSKKKKRKKEDEDDKSTFKPNIKGLEISVEVESIHAKKKRKSKEEKLFTWMRQLAHRIQKETQIHLHKCHLLCLLANALNENRCCNLDILKAVCLSMIPSEYFKPLPCKWDINHLRRFTTWFQKDIPDVQELLLYIDQEAQQLGKLKRIHVFVIMMRSIGFLCRIIYSLLPCTSKIKNSDLTTFGDAEDKMIASTSKETAPKKSRQKRKNSKKKREGGTTSPYFSNQDDPDPDFIIQNESKVSGKTRTKRNSKCKKNNTSTSPQEASHYSATTGINIWAEVYMETLKRWICVELASLTINAPFKCEVAASKPLQYVIGIDNDQKIKDVTCRYAEKWLTVNRKLRVDRDWWAQSIDPYKPNKDDKDSAEDAQMRTNLMQKDLPKSISDLKDHPLYALKRHLLKFQAIYPEAVVPVGYINKEAIYPRDCVHDLHTRETWMKKARCIKPGEDPYKIVKGRLKWNERHLNKEVFTQCFGIWQTELYVPPPVVDGKVTKNEYGNVELYQASMLPEGAIHLPMANIKQVARTLEIDYAPAMMGWDFHGGFSHPIFEGIVVAKEYEDILLDAWNKQEELREKKEEMKREKAIYDNWRKLIKGLLIRARLKDKYAFEEDENAEVKASNTGKADKKSAVESKMNIKPAEEQNDEEDIECTSVSEYWPNKRMDG